MKHGYKHWNIPGLGIKENSRNLEQVTQPLIFLWAEIEESKFELNIDNSCRRTDDRVHFCFVMSLHDFGACLLAYRFNFLKFKVKFCVPSLARLGKHCYLPSLDYVKTFSWKKGDICSSSHSANQTTKMFFSSDEEGSCFSRVVYNRTCVSRLVAASELVPSVSAYIFYIHGHLLACCAVLHWKSSLCVASLCSHALN